MGYREKKNHDSEKTNSLSEGMRAENLSMTALQYDKQIWYGSQPGKLIVSV